MAGYWPRSLFAWTSTSSRSLFACLWTSTSSRSIKTQKDNSANPAILTELAWSIKGLLHGIKSTEKMIIVLVYFRALKRKPVICKSDNVFRFSRFLVPSRRRNHRKCFHCHGKYFAKENFPIPAWTLAKFIAGTKRAIPSRQYRFVLPARIVNWFILPAREACHIIKQIFGPFTQLETEHF